MSGPMLAMPLKVGYQPRKVCKKVPHAKNYNKYTENRSFSISVNWVEYPP